MELMPIVLTVVLVVLAIVLSVVGVQLVMVLVELRRALQRVNATLEVAEERIEQIVRPLQSLGGAAAGLKTGMRVFETFVGWLNRDQKK